MAVVDDVLARHGKSVKHSGVKGMHWGVRKADHGSGPEPIKIHTQPGKQVSVSGGKHHDPHDDAVKVAVSRQKARKSSLDALSNKELQDLVGRMNMEQQYSRLIATDPRAQGDLQKFLKQAAVVGKTVKNVNAFLNSPSGKLLKTALKAKLG